MINDVLREYLDVSDILVFSDEGMISTGCPQRPCEPPRAPSMGEAKKCEFFRDTIEFLDFLDFVI